MQVIDVRVLADLLTDTSIPDGIITLTADRELQVSTDDACDYTVAVAVLAEAIGQGAAADASTSIRVTSTGGTFGGAATLTAVFPGFTLSGPLPVPVP